MLDSIGTGLSLHKITETKIFSNLGEQLKTLLVTLLIHSQL